ERFAAERVRRVESRERGIHGPFADHAPDDSWPGRQLSTPMKIRHEDGIALVLTLFLMSAISVMAASLMFLSQSETYASMNYRMMSQARYAAESGVEKASDFLLDSAQYTVPPTTSYSYRVSPVR